MLWWWVRQKSRIHKCKLWILLYSYNNIYIYIYNVTRSQKQYLYCHVIFRGKSNLEIRCGSKCCPRLEIGMACLEPFSGIRWWQLHTTREMHLKPATEITTKQIKMLPITKIPEMGICIQVRNYWLWYLVVNHAVPKIPWIPRNRKLLQFSSSLNPINYEMRLCDSQCLINAWRVPNILMILLAVYHCCCCTNYFQRLVMQNESPMILGTAALTS